MKKKLKATTFRGEMYDRRREVLLTLSIEEEKPGKTCIELPRKRNKPRFNQLAKIIDIWSNDFN